MDDKSLNTFVGELKSLLISRDFDITDKDTPTLKYEIKRAIAQINRCRRFKATEENPYDKKYEDLIIPLAISSFAKIGAEGQTVHSENGITRHYTSGGDYPKELLSEIIPLIR
jgi:hypothetical protein